MNCCVYTGRLVVELGIQSFLLLLHIPSFMFMLVISHLAQFNLLRFTNFALSSFKFSLCNVDRINLWSYLCNFLGFVGLHYCWLSYDYAIVTVITIYMSRRVKMLGFLHSFVVIASMLALLSL